MVVELPTRQGWRTLQDNTHERMQMVIGFRCNHQAMALALHSRPILPHQALVDSMQVFVHPAGQVPLRPSGKDTLEIVLARGEGLPPPIDEFQHIAARLRFRLIRSIYEHPSHHDLLHSIRSSNRYCTASATCD